MVSFKDGWREIPGFDDEKCFGPKSVRMNWAHGKEEPIVSYEEAPWVMKRNGTYYLSYAAGGVPEHMAYSTAPTINGPWAYRGKIMDTPHNSFTIHGGNIEFKGRSYCFGLNYDVLRLQTSKHHERRSVSAQEMEYAPDGTIPELPYFKSGVLRQVGAFDPFCGVEAAMLLGPKGGHGYGSRKTGRDNDAWPELAAVWLKRTFGLEGK